MVFSQRPRLSRSQRYLLHVIPLSLSYLLFPVYPLQPTNKGKMLNNSNRNHFLKWEP